MWCKVLAGDSRCCRCCWDFDTQEIYRTRKFCHWEVPGVEENGTNQEDQR